MVVVLTPFVDTDALYPILSLGSNRFTLNRNGTLGAVGELRPMATHFTLPGHVGPLSVRVVQV